MFPMTVGGPVLIPTLLFMLVMFPLGESAPERRAASPVLQRMTLRPFLSGALQEPATNYIRDA